MAACGSPPPAATPASAPPTAPELGPIPRADFTVVPAELGDPGVLDRIPHRVRVRRLGRAWITPGSEPMRQRADDDASDRDFVLPVIGEAAGRIRVVTEDSGSTSRVAVWLAREDVWPALVVPRVLVDRAGVASGISGKLGAPLVLAEQRAGRRRAVRIPDEELRVEGFVDEAAIAAVWLAPGDLPEKIDGTASHEYNPPNDPRPVVELSEGTAIRRDRAASSPVIAVVTGESVRASVVATVGGVRELVLDRPYFTVRGFVDASATRDVDDLLGTIGTGGGYGFGMSHADRIDVPAGTCLFAAIDGEVVGVQLVQSTRLGRLDAGPNGWSSVHVGTVWGHPSVFIHDLADDPKQPRWDSCLDPGQRR